MEVADFRRELLKLVSKAWKTIPADDVLYVMLLSATSLLYAQRERFKNG